MISKTSQAVQLFNSGNIAGALKIFSSFKIGVSKEENRTLKIAYESMTGKDDFYRSLAIDTTAIQQSAIQIIRTKYNL